MNKNQKNIFWLGITALFLGAVIVFLRPEVIWGFLATVLVLLVFFWRLEWGLYLMTALYPFIYWQLVFGSLNVPWVDAIALLLFTAWLIKILIQHFRGEKSLTLKDFPGWIFFILFLISGILSLLNAPDWLASLKYLLRPLAFFYLMFVFLPVNLISNLRILKNVLWILYGVGILTALMGLWSLAFPASHELFRRALPPLINGFNPLGSSHNVLAEVLVGIIPIGWLLAITDKQGLRQRWLWLGLILMLAINLMTFSRAGWLALILEVITLIIFYYRQYWRKIFGTFLAILILLLPIWFLLGEFLNSPLVKSSNSNRWYLTTIAWQSFKSHPWTGAGAGTFIQKVAQDQWYLLDFGSPLEAHGVIQKLGAELGILGIATFLGLLAFCFWYLWQTYKKLPEHSNWRTLILCLSVSALGSAFFQLFNTSYFISKLWLPIGVAMASAHLARRENKLKI